MLKLLNKDKRSLILSLVLGDGSLGVYKVTSGNGYYGKLSIDHGLEQADYQAWKAKLLSDIFERDVKVRTGHKGKSVQVAISDRRFKAWHSFCYPNNKKDLSKILPFIKHPEMALAIWLMDDGYVESSFSKLKSGDKVNYGARFRIFTCDQTLETQDKIIKWFETIFQITPKIKFSFKKSANRHYPFIKINQKDSLILWTKIREFILQFKSMRYKFRYMEDIYQKRLQEPTPAKAEDIVGNKISH